MQKIGFCDKYSLTQAVLDGTKTMTRRVEKGLENLEEGNFCYSKHDNGILLYGEKGSVIETIKTRYKLGEVVAVAQSYKSIHEEMTNGDYGDSKYDAFRCAMVANTPGWSNKMFVRADLMPHQIKIMGVRIERLQYITLDDYLKEGINKLIDSQGNTYYYVKGITGFYYSPRVAFAALINRPGVGRKGLWESNPFVVVYEFKLIK